MTHRTSRTVVSGVTVLTSVVYDDEHDDCHGEDGDDDSGDILSEKRQGRNTVTEGSNSGPCNTDKPTRIQYINLVINPFT